MTSLEFQPRTNVARRLVRLAHHCMDVAMEQYGIRGGLGERVEQ
jgi:hypothetical protein